MTKIHVSASHDYDVIISRGCLGEAGEHARAVLGARRAAIVSDSNVLPLYGAALRESLEKAGLSVSCIAVPAGEESKCLERYGEILEFFCREGLTRADVVVALGGGMVGDLAGFCAATYQRGVALVQVPTTLLAMVDSSVGGKTAIDLRGGKNQAGCFYQPSLVLCDPDTLRSLPEREYRAGCAEVIKYGVLGSAELFSALEDSGVRAREEDIIAACVDMKREIVAMDEFDTGERKKLNLGHTIGHAVESAEGFRLLHGECVAVGLAVICRAAAKFGYMPQCDADRVVRLLEKTGLPAETALERKTLLPFARADKKRSGESLDLVVPERIGACRIVRIPAQELDLWMAAGGIL